MPGEFVISPRHPVSSQPISPFSSSASQGSKDNSKATDIEAQAQYEHRPSVDSMDSISKAKASASSSPPKSSMRAALSKAAHRLSPSHSRSSSKDAAVLAGSEEEFESMKKQEVEAQKRQEEYAKYGLGAKGFGKGSMQMNG